MRTPAPHLLLLAAVALPTGCSLDNLLSGKDDEPGFDDGDSGDDSGLDSDVDVEELCNGLDDDGDGAIDEGWPDADGDGVADCVDGDGCPGLTLPSARDLTVDTECVGETYALPEPLADAFNLRVQWQFDWGTDTRYRSQSPPLVADLDGDGTPELLMVSYSRYLYAVNGATGALEWIVDDTNHALVPALADLDGDGQVEILGADPDCHPRLWSSTGDVVWTSTATASVCSYSAAAIADLDGDGNAEAIVDDVVLDAATGTFLFQLGVASGWREQSLAIADLDLDGHQEILLAGYVFDFEGNLLWRASAPGTQSYPVIVNADDDDEAEVAWLDGGFSVYDTDGTPLYEPAWSDTFAVGPPCAADFDGDGRMEVAFPRYLDLGFEVMELTGDRLWGVAGPWRTLGAGCSAFDFDGDGALEVVYAADESMYVYDGRTGATVMEWADHASTTSFEFPTVADVDGDGHAEIALISMGAGDHHWLTVLEHDGEGWPETEPYWTNGDFTQTNVDSDLTVPRRPDPSWLGHKVYRARTVIGGSTDGANLRAWITDVCVDSCESGTVEVGVQAGNQGPRGVAAGAELALYSLDSAGEETEVARVTLPELPSGRALDAVRVSLPLGELGELGFRVRVDPDDVVDECEEGDNEDEWVEVVCP